MKLSQRKITWILILTFLVSLMTACKAAETPPAGAAQEPTLAAQEAPTETEPETEAAYVPLDHLELRLPDGWERQRVKEDEDSFLQNGTVTGGAFLMDCDDSLFDDVLGYFDPLMTLTKDALVKNRNVSEPEWHMGGSSLYGIAQMGMGNDQYQYEAYVVRGKSACYLLWFDRNRVSEDTEEAIMESLKSEDVTKELNMVSNEQYNDAIAESMAQEEYEFTVTMPQGYTQTEVTDGAMFYRDGELVGGHKVIHFEKGILPDLETNRDLVLSRLTEDLKDQVDMTGFDGTLDKKGFITATFTKDDKEYTHYITSYGQVGTQYDLWFDTSLLTEDEVNAILFSAQLKQLT